MQIRLIAPLLLLSFALCFCSAIVTTATERTENGNRGGFRILPREAVEVLDLTPGQKEQIDALEKEARKEFDAILTPAQRQKMEAIHPPRREQEPSHSALIPREGSLAQSLIPPKNIFDRLAKPLKTFELRSSAIGVDGVLPKEFTGDGESATPPLEWSGAPRGTKSFVLVMHHTDVENKTTSYWVLYDIPGDVKALPKNVHGIGTLGVNGKQHRAGYTAPHSKGPGKKTYVFTLYALAKEPALTFDRSEVKSSGVTSDVLLAAIEHDILATADLKTNYTR